MDDRFQTNLTRQLTTYADTRTRPIDPVRLATEVIGSGVARPRSSWRRARLRWMVLAAAATAAVAGATLIAIGPGARGLLAPTVVASPSSGPSPTSDGADLRVAILLTDLWRLDFAASALDGRVDPSFLVDIGSTLTFTDSGFVGGTGYGGGCDSFSGTFTSDGNELKLTFETLRQGCDPGSPQDVVERLVKARQFQLLGCTGPVVHARPDARTSCETLVLFDDPLDDPSHLSQKLVYHRRL